MSRTKIRGTEILCSKALLDFANWYIFVSISIKTSFLIICFHCIEQEYVTALEYSGFIGIKIGIAEEIFSDIC